MDLRKEVGVPHRGWECIAIEDVKESNGVYRNCEMCGHEKIRFLYYMKHNRYSKTLKVGCICARDMIEDYTNIDKWEKELKNRQKRKRNWLKRKWRITLKGNRSLVIHGIIVVVYKKNGFWDYCFKGSSFDNIYGNKKFNNEEEAKLKAFDILFPPYIYENKSIE